MKSGLGYLLRAGLGIPDYWHPRIELQTDFQSGKIGRYPMTMDLKGDYPGTLNEEGVPVPGGNARPAPVEVTLYGLGSHDRFLATRDERYRQQLFCSARWLEKHCVPLGQGVGWANQYDIAVWGLKAPWFSAIVHGFALSLLVRAHQLDSAGPWSELAKQAWRGFRVPVEQGGYCRKLDQGVIYEEYPRTELDCVFNGMCHALIGLWEAWQSGLLDDAQQDFHDGFRGLRRLLPEFKHDGWSLYSLNRCLGSPFLASPFYHRVNGVLAQAIGIMADDDEFRSCGQRWMSTSRPIVRRLRMSLRIGLDRYRYARTRRAINS